MAPSVSLLYILFTVGFLLNCSTGVTQLELGVHFVEEPGDVIGIKGKPLALPCMPRTSRPSDLLEIKWYHNNKHMDLTNDKRRTIFQNGTLYFSKLVHKRAGHSDQGEYRCVVVKENCSLSSRPGFLRISVLPENFYSHPVGQNVEAGSNIRLSCGIDSYPEVEIEWGRDNQKLPQNVLKYATVSGPGIHGSILYIFNAVPDDSGSYRCTAKNILLNKQRHSSSGLVTVLPRTEENGLSQKTPTFLTAQQTSSPSFSPTVREVKEGDNITLDCVAATASPAPTLTWTFLPHGQSKAQRIFNQTNTGHNIRQIRNTTRHQAGWYTCSAMNLPERELTMELKVLTPPEIQEKSENIVFRASKTVRFRCVAYGNPVPEIYWLKDGSLFSITGRIKHRTSVNESQQLRLSELILSSTVTSDAGIYQCMAKNSVGWTWAASRLFLNATRPAPLAPEKVSCEPLSSSEIKLSWDVPEAVDKIIAFSIHYHLTDDGEEMQRVMPADSRSTQIDKLLPFTNYTFYVRLYVDSASEFSEKTVCQTGEEVPVDAPEKKLKIISPNSVHVSWVPLPKEKARGVITKYKIQYRINGSPSSKVEEVTSDVLDYTITGLVPGKKYEVRVLAATSKGWPDTDLPWELLELPLNYSSNLPTAPEVTLQAINSSSIEVKWILSSRGTEIIGYKIFYRKHNSNQLGPLKVPPDIKRFILTGLDPGTWYEVMVLGFTKEDDGETGIGSIHTLSKEGSSDQLPLESPTILEPPLSLEADPVSPVAINLSWRPPQTTSGFNGINYYTVCFNPVQTSRNKNATVTCVKSPETKVLIVGLTPYTLYEFKVRSHDVNNKQSVFSQTVECHTLEDVPSQVVDISWEALNKTTVQVTWKEPRQSNGVIRNYTLYYTQDSALPLTMWSIKTVSASNFRTQLTDLESNMRYFLVVRASTGAGLGSYNTPKQMLIPSPVGVPRDEPTPKTTRDKQSDHYIGILVGLGIGFFFIILCTTCILCRRRCLKQQSSQEFEVTSSRHSDRNECHGDRELVTESREAEYFTFFSSQRERPNGMEIAVQHLDTKGHYPNGSVNGIRMSLLSEGRTSNGSGRSNIYITENPRYDPNCSESPLLSPRTHSNSSRRSSETLDHLKLPENRRRNSKILSVKGKNSNSGSEASLVLNNSDSLPGSHSSGGQTPPSRTQPSVTDGDIATKLSEDDQWTDLNTVLKNPEFRFSDSSSVSGKIGRRKNGFALPGGFYGGALDGGFSRNPVYKTSFPMMSKEITQES